MDNIVFVPGFLSTLSLRRATIHHKTRRQPPSHFYPRSPCGERLSLMLYDTSSLIFLSTLSLRRATFPAPKPPIMLRFLSTLSLRRATTHPVTILVRVVISIHALLAESDQFCGCQRGPGIAFLSTLSLRRATL